MHMLVGACKGQKRASDLSGAAVTDGCQPTEVGDGN